MKNNEWNTLETLLKKLETEGDGLLDAIEMTENPFEEHAAVSMFEAFFDEIDNALNLLNDCDWEAVREEMAPFLKSEAQKDNWRTLGELVCQYKAAQAAGNEALYQRLLLEIKQLSRKLLAEDYKIME